ncbi:MAG: carbohydrate binding domain-containing protein [Abditibacteriaceae bacterium]
MKSKFLRSTLVILAMVVALAIHVIPAHAQSTSIVIDDFENGTANWSLNDSFKNSKPDVQPQLVNLMDVPPGAPMVDSSTMAGLFTFKSANGAWASANIRVSGKAWAEIGAQRLTFYLNAGGNNVGFNIQLRRVVSGQDDEVFKLPKAVRLDQHSWRKVVIPLTDFKSSSGALIDRLNGVYLFQIVMTGTWDTRFFSLDQLQVEGTGKAAPQPVVAPPKAPTQSPAANASLDKNTSAVNVDYLKLIGRVRSTADTSIGASDDANVLPLVNNRGFRVAIRELKPSWVRLDAGELSELEDSSKPRFDFSKLVAATKSTRSIGAKVLLTLSDRADWGLSSDNYAAFAAQAAKAVNHDGTIVTDFELATMSSGRDIGNAVIAYNSARSALKKLSSKYQVGGITSSSRDDSTLPVFLAAADGLDFLTIRDFGQSGDEQMPSTDQFSAARNMQRLSDAAQDLDSSRWRNARIFVITNLEQHPAGSKDKAPLLQLPAAAWWTTYLINVSRLADQIFHNDATNPQWGLLDAQVRAFPSYYAMWLWNTFVPPGSERVATEVKGDGITAMGVNSPTSHNLVLANGTDHAQTARIAIRGFPVLHKVRIWMYDNPQKQPYLLTLPNSPYQTIQMAPYAVAVVQFIEPTKK